MKKLIFLILLILSLLNTGLFVQAASPFSTSYTLSSTAQGDGYQIVQDAYLPVGVYLDLGLNGAEDIDIKGHMAYIADTGNKRIIVMNLQDGTNFSVGEGLLSKPTGVAADLQGRIYVADYSNHEAYRFSSTGELEQTYVRHETPRYGINSKFVPRKISPAKNGGVYLIVEGSSGGIVHMNGKGDFLGYYISNYVQKNALERFLDSFLTEEQQRFFRKKTPNSFGNLMTDGEGLLYTSNMGIGDRIQKYSLSGLVMQSNLKNQPVIDNIADIAVHKNGGLYAINTQGYIWEMTRDGFLLCLFGGSSQETDRLGLFDVPTGLGVDDHGKIYVLDKKRNCIQVFEATSAQKHVHEAIDAYNKGDYEQAQQYFSETLRINESSYYAHIYMGKTYMHKGNYTSAVKHFKIAHARAEYSEAFWEIRNQWLQNHMPVIFVVLVSLFLIRLLYKWQRQKMQMLVPVRLWNSFTSKRIIHDFSHLGYELRHPIDNAYDIKAGYRGSPLTATLLYLILFVVFITRQIGSGFIFATPAEDFPVLIYFGYFLVILLTFILGNYLITSINDGKGSLHSLYISVAYSFAPVIIVMPFLTLLGNFLTFNEQFIFSFGLIVLVSWCILNVSLSLMEIHEYSLSQFMKTTLLTILLMAVAVLLGSIIYLLIKQIIDFVIQVYVEVVIRD